MNQSDRWKWISLLVIPGLAAFFPILTPAKRVFSNKTSPASTLQDQRGQEKPAQPAAPVRPGNQNEQTSQPNPTTSSDQPKPIPEKPDTTKQTSKDKAWGILHGAISDDSAEKRGKAVLALGLMTGDKDAEKEAIAALKDDKANVRISAATALGSIGLATSKAPLEKAVDDDDPGVMMACANALLLLKDNTGYEVYYAVLTGEKKGKKNFISEQLTTLKDKKKLAQIGLDEGIGFIPFAGIPYTVLKMVLQDSSTGVRAAAAKRLAHDPDPNSGEALVGALGDKSWVLRAAALEAISLRDDRSLLPKVEPVMDDDKDDVRYRAAACTLHLSRSRNKLKSESAVAAASGTQGR